MPEPHSPSLDSIVLLLLCSHLCLNGEDHKPLSVRDWNRVKKTLDEMNLQPAHLLNMHFDDLQQCFSTSELISERLSALLSRRTALEFEINRLARQGIFALTLLDPGYPDRYRERLKGSAPPLLFYAGDHELLGQPGSAVVGSRKLDSIGEDCARYVGSACGFSGMVLYSGGAKGVDTISMSAALEARGTAVGILADSLESTVRRWETTLKKGDLCLVSPNQPARRVHCWSCNGS